MFLCRTGRLPSAAALGQAQALKCPGSFLLRIEACGPGDVTLTARTGLWLQPHRLICASVGGLDPNRAHLGQQRQQTETLLQNWVTSAGFITTERGHLDWGAVDLSNGVQRGAGNTRRHKSRANTEVLLFTGNRRVCSRRCSSSSSSLSFITTTMQKRASSTSATAKKSEEQADGSKVEASTTSTSEKGPEDSPESTPEPGGEKPNKTQQLKKVFKEYGAVGVSFHIGISLMSLGMFYLLISSGIDMVSMLSKLGFSETVVQSKMAAGTSTFVLAYAVHKLFAPIRISITLVSVPLIVRYFRKTGLFKPPTPAP